MSSKQPKKSRELRAIEKDHINYEKGLSRFEAA
jgi:hypothetical protein